jgi:hypothetical protein
VTTTVDAIDFDWAGGSPATGIRNDDHSTLFVGKLVAPTEGTYEILGFGDDDVHVFVDGELVSSDPLGHGQADPRSTDAVNRGGGARPIYLTAGNHELAVLHAEQGGGSGVRLRWVLPGGNSAAPTVVPAANLLAEVTPVTAPTGLTRDASEANGVKINFTDTSDTELRYDLQRRAGTTGDWTTVAKGHINDNSITDYSAKFGTAYQYRVVAWNLQGEAASTQTVSATLAVPTAATSGAQGYYFNDQWWKAGAPTNTNGTGTIVGYAPDFTENVGDVVEDYGDGNGTTPGSPEPGVIRSDNHSTVFTGRIQAPETGEYYVLGFSDDDSYVYVNGQLVSADPGGHGIPVNTYSTANNNGIPTIDVRNRVSLTAGQSYDFVAVHSEGGGGSGMILRWVLPSQLEADPQALPSDVPLEAFVSNQASTPLAPTALTATATDVSVARLSWTDASTSEVRYVLERSTSQDFSNATRTLLGINATSYQDTTLERGTTYYYRLTAENFTGSSQAATTTLATPGTSPTPAAPSNLVAYNVGDRNFITFTDNSTNETGFVLERRLASGGDFVSVTGSPLAGTGPNVTGGTISFVDATGVVAGQTYVYRVRAANVDNIASANSNEATTTVQGLRATLSDSIGRFGARNFYDTPAPGVNPIVRQDPNVDVDWGNNGPATGIDGDFFTAVWEGYFTPTVGGEYTFYADSDDGMRIFIDGQQITVDNTTWIDRSGETASTPVTLTANQPVEIRVQYYENGGGARARLRYSGPGIEKQIVPISALTPANASNPLRAPSNVTVSSTMGQSLNLTWIDNSASETGYRIERSTDFQTFTPIATVPANQSAYIDAKDIDPTFGTIYYYRVVALGANGTEAAAEPTSGNYPYEPAQGAVNFADFSDPSVQALWSLVRAGDAPTATTPGTNLATTSQFVDGDGDGDFERLRLTDGSPTDTTLNGQRANAYLTAPVVVSNGFTSSFDFVAGGAGLQSANPADGFAWILQATTLANDIPARTGQTAMGGGGGGLSYAGLNNSLALKFDIYNNLNQTGLYLNGDAISDDPADPRNRVIPGTLDINSGTRLHVEIGYDPKTKVLTQTIDDIGNAETTPFVASYVVDLDAVLGQGSAFIGFGGATGGERARQEILSFAFDPNAPVSSAVVSEVYVRSSAWLGNDNNATNTTFMEYLEAKGLGDDVLGYRLYANGSAVAGPANNPEQILPWINMDQVVVRYSAPPTGAGVPTPGALTLNGQRSSYVINSVTQVPGDPTAFVLTLNKPLGGGDPVTGVAPTSSENGDRVTLSVPGAGSGGSNFSFRMNVTQGDTDHLNETSHNVLARDYAEVKKRFFKNTNQAASNPDTDYTPFHDVDGNGQILARDYAEVKKRFFQNLPAASTTTQSFAAASATQEMFGSAAIL